MVNNILFNINNKKNKQLNIPVTISQMEDRNLPVNITLNKTHSENKNEEVKTNFPFNKTEKYTNIFIICGAGISTNAGIPDFRSKNSFNSFLKKFNYTNTSFFSEVTAQTNVINTGNLKNLRICYKNQQIIFINKWDSIVYKISYEIFLNDLYFLVYICRISRSLRKELSKHINMKKIINIENYNDHLNAIIPSKRARYLILLTYFILGTFKKPTKTHELMKFLNKESILKVFTQNVDLLEQYCIPDNNSALSFYNTNVVNKKILTNEKTNNSLIYIHGNLAHITCNVCLIKIPLTFDILHLWAKGAEKYCKFCIENCIIKRSLKYKEIGRYSSNIVNYDSLHPDSEYICKVINDNTKRIRNGLKKKKREKCLILILGTTLSTYSVKSLLNTLLYNFKSLLNVSLEENKAKFEFDSLVVNKTINKNCKKKFDYFFEGDCDFFTTEFIKKQFGEEKYENFLKDYEKSLEIISKKFEIEEIEEIEEKVNLIIDEFHKTVGSNIFIDEDSIDNDYMDLNTSFTELSINISPVKQKRKI